MRALYRTTPTAHVGSNTPTLPSSVTLAVMVSCKKYYSSTDGNIAGFLLPPDQIKPSGDEALAAVLPLADAIVNDKTLSRK